MIIDGLRSRRKASRRQRALVEPVEREGLGGGGAFVRQGDQIAFDIARRHRGHREHVVLDAVAFDIVELEVLQGIDQGGVAMGEAMPLVFAVIPVVPVVQEVIVQEGRANQGFEVDAVPQVCAVGHPHSQQATRTECSNVVTLPCW